MQQQTIATEREPTSKNSPHSVEIYVPSPEASSPSSEVQSAPGGRFSSTPGSESASGKPRRRSRDPGRPPQRSCRTRRRQAGREAREEGWVRGQVKSGQVRVSYLQSMTGLSGCRMGNCSSSMSGPLRLTRPSPQFSDTRTSRGSWRPVTIWPSSVTTSHCLRRTHAQ